ncbi:Hypothetical predicted protein [Scomber scombrus]
MSLNKLSATTVDVQRTLKLPSTPRLIVSGLLLVFGKNVCSLPRMNMCWRNNSTFLNLAPSLRHISGKNHL